MDTKPKINPNGTYVFDERDIEQLDELSLTSMVTALVEAIPDEPELKSPADTVTSPNGDTTINEILGAPTLDDQPPEQSGLPEPAGDLLAPEFVFPELTRGWRR